MADLSQTAASVLMSASGQAAQGIIAAATTVTAGVVLYTLANGTLGLADADAVSPGNSVAGIALTGGGAGQPVIFCSRDAGGLNIGATMTVGAVQYLSPSAGGRITETYADILTGDTVIVLGIALTATTMIFDPLVGGAKP